MTERVDTREPAGSGPATPADGSPTALIVIDLDGWIVQFGEDAEALLGHPADEAVGARLSELIIPERMRAAHEAGLARYRRSGSGPVLANTYEMPALRRDGSEILVHLSVSPLRIGDRDLLVGAVRPAGPERVISAELSLSADFFRAIVECAPIVISVTGDDHAERWVSPAAERLFGARSAASLLETVVDLVHPADRARALARLSDPASLTQPAELRLRTSAGDWRAVSFVAADLRDHPAVGGLVFFGVDVTRARTAEARERDESARLLALLDSLAVGVLVEDGERRIRLTNPALVEIFNLGVPPPALAGTRLTDRPPAGADPAGWAALARVAIAALPADTTNADEPTAEPSDDEPTGDEIPDAEPSGDEIPDAEIPDAEPFDAEPSDDEHAAEPAAGLGAREVALPHGRVVETVSTAITGGGGPVGRLWVIHDVTAAVEARRALEEHNRRLSALSALKSEFIAIVSHELRTPLTSISAFTEMLTGPGELTSPDAPEAVAAIARNTDRMLVLVQDLRLLSQLETGAQAVATGTVDVPDLIREVGDGVDVGGRVVAVRLDLADGPRLDGDERLLRQLVHTVVGTVAACAAGEELAVRAEADQAGWTVRATAASGEFVTDEQLLATPLPVLDDASRQRSAALSVLLSRAIATSHGGTLQTEVRAGETATITVRLPFDAGRGPDTAPD